MSNNAITSIDIQVMTVKGYTDVGYQLGKLEFNSVDFFTAPWYGPIEGFYSRLPIGTNVLTKKIPGETRLCHIIGIDRNTIEDTQGILNGKPDERIVNTQIDPMSGDIVVYKRGYGQLLLSEDGISLDTPHGYGFKILNTPNSIYSNIISIGDSALEITSAMEKISGKLYVPKSGSTSGTRFSFENFGNADETVFGRFKTSGFFPKSRVSEMNTRLNLPRNYNRVTYKYMGKEFLGFDFLKNIHLGSSFSVSKIGKALESNPYFGHHFLPNDATSSIYGGIFSSEGFEYDSHFKEMKYGNSSSKRSSSPLDLGKTREIFKRGIAKFEAINTNVFSQSEIGSAIEKNNISITDRQGFSRIFRQKNSFSGNLPILSENSLTVGTDGRVVAKNEVVGRNKKERNPIVFVRKNGLRVPATTQTKRDSGIRYSNISSFNKNNDSGDFRANPTRYHNIYAAAEQMFAAYPKKIVNATDGGVISSRVEHWFADGAGSESGKTTGGGPEEIGELASKGLGSSYVVVGPVPSAVKTGGAVGDMHVAGKNVSSEKSFSNKFSVNKEGNVVRDEDYESPGGYSMLLDSAGAIMASIGKSDADGVSAVIDTQGGIVSWIGADNNGRSITTQTDGSINICVGGPELSENSNITYNPGRLEIRVSVVDKGFVGSEKAVKEGDSDYIISISEKGLVIAGGKKSSPIVISSNGDLNLESLGGNVNLVANQGKVRYKTGAGQFNEISYKEFEAISTGKYLNIAANLAGEE